MHGTALTLILATVLTTITTSLADETTIAPPATRPIKSILELSVSDTKGQPVALEQYRGNVLLLVNVASRCGHTPQYAKLEQVYRKYQDQGFLVLALPANDFGNQEPGSNEEIITFCRSKYDVTFPVFGKLTTKGEGQSPLYQFLTGKDTNPSFAGPIAWNFTKFLISREGQVIARFNSATKPDDPKLLEALERELSNPKPTK